MPPAAPAITDALFAPLFSSLTGQLRKGVRARLDGVQDRRWLQDFVRNQVGLERWFDGRNMRRGESKLSPHDVGPRRD